MLTNPAVAHARALAEAGTRPEPGEEVTGLDASGKAILPTLADANVDPRRIRISQLASNRVPARVLRGDNNPIPSLGCRYGYVVEVLPKREMLNSHSIVLYLQRRQPNVRGLQDTLAQVAKRAFGADDKDKDKGKDKGKDKDAKKGDDKGTDGGGRSKGRNTRAARRAEAAEGSGSSATATSKNDPPISDANFCMVATSTL